MTAQSALRSPQWTLVFLGMLAAGFAGGCGGGSADDLTLFCGAGIRPPVADLIETFEREHGVTIAADYAGSEVLLSRLKLSRQGDLFMPGDQHYLDLAQAEGLVTRAVPVCYFVPTILVRKDSPFEIEGLRDLLKPGVRLGLGDAEACAIGIQSKKIFEKNGIPWAEVEKNLEFASATVNELGIQIETGALDAVIVWDATAAYYAAHGREVPIPLDQNVVSTVPIGILAFTRNAGLAQSFVDFATSERGRAVFRRHQYRTDPPE